MLKALWLRTALQAVRSLRQRDRWMPWADRNMADYWRWIVFLSQRKDGSWSRGASQTDASGATYRMQVSIALGRARRLEDGRWGDPLSS